MMKTYLFFHLIVATLALSSCITTSVDDYQAVTNKLTQALRNQDYARADKIMGEINTEFPGGTDVDLRLLQWAEIKIALGNKDEAKKLLEQMIWCYPKSMHISTATALHKSLERKHNKVQEDTSRNRADPQH